MVGTQKKRVMVLALAVILLLGGWLGYDGLTRSRIITGPMVQNIAPDGFWLVWRMTNPDEVTVEVVEGDQVVANAAELALADRRYQAHVVGLKPGTSYRYRILSQGKVVGEFPVETAPLSGRPFRFVAFGDSGKNTWAQRRLAEVVANFAPNLIIHTGDLLTPDARPSGWPTKFFYPYKNLLPTVPIYPCLGNHEFRTDQAAPVLAEFVLPENGPVGQEPERFYWFDYGDVRFVAIDSNFDFPLYRDVIAGWLDGVLAHAEDRYKVVFFHEPIFTNGKYPGAKKLIDSILEVLDRHRVHLVLNGHNHMYERSHPIRDGDLALPGQGTIFVVTGAGGCNLYDYRLPAPGYSAVYNDRIHSFTVVDVLADYMTLRQVGIDERVIDQVVIPR